MSVFDQTKVSKPLSVTGRGQTHPELTNSMMPFALPHIPHLVENGIRAHGLCPYAIFGDVSCSQEQLPDGLQPPIVD
jgi:hypothetical protein